MEVPSMSIVFRGDGRTRVSTGTLRREAPSAMTTDEQLLQAFVDGDDDALRTLALRHEPMLLSIARGLVSNDHELARDVVQEAWTKVIRSAGRFRGQAAVRTWLVRIVMNCARDANRRARVRQRTMNTLRQQSLVAAGAQANSSSAQGETGGSRGGSENWGASGGSSGIDAADQELIARALARLPDELRECVVLCVGRGMTHQEASAVLGWPIGTLKTRLTRAMKTLRAAAKELSGDGA